jgi:tetratricopeptide (TPR) repeat protein
VLYLAIASLFIGALTSLALHEFSHAIAGRLAQLQIRELRIGLGPTVFRARLLKMEIYIGAIPLAGRVMTFPQLSWSKSANLYFIAAGPVMDVVWFAILIGAMALYRDSELAGAILMPPIVFQIVVLFGNLPPRYIKVYGLRVPNDVLALWKIIHGYNPFEAHREHYLKVLPRYMRADDTPWHPTGQSDRIAFYVFKLDLTDEDISALEDELAHTTFASEQLLLIETAATKILGKSAPPPSRLNALLDHLTEKAVAIAPELSTLKGTRGAALARLGRHEEALNILAQADESDDFNRCLNAAFRALAHSSAGQGDQAVAEIETSIAILRSDNLANSIGGKIVDVVCVEIGYPTLKEHETATPLG